MPETTPLLSQPAEGAGYYFLNHGQEGTTSLVRDNDGGAVVEGMPAGSNAEEFEPKKVGANTNKEEAGSPSKEPNILEKIFGGPKKTDQNGSNKMGSLAKSRKAPVKVEPKVFFANERTFLAWMHISIILAGASIAILAFSGSEDDTASQMYGVVMLPVAIAFIVYSMYQYVRRAHMIRNKLPGPYDDTVGPTVLGIMLMMSIIAQFAIKLWSMSFV